jgi:hypothetical protein
MRSLATWSTVTMLTLLEKKSTCMVADLRIATPKHANSNTQVCLFLSQVPPLEARFASGASQPTGPQKHGTCFKLEAYNELQLPILLDLSLDTIFFFTDLVHNLVQTQPILYPRLHTFMEFSYMTSKTHRVT